MAKSDQLYIRSICPSSNDSKFFQKQRNVPSKMKCLEFLACLLVGICAVIVQVSADDPTPPNPCDSSPCMHDGTCTVSDDGANYTCQCKGSFSGVNCEIGPCDSNPCMNGGNCTASEDGENYTCQCKGSFSGVNCEIGNCQNKTCENGGTCKVDSEGEELCHCVNPFYGDKCELKDPPCCVEPTDILWVDYGDGQQFPDNAVVGCQRTGCDIYVGRAKANGEGNYIPGKITADKVCHVASGEKEFNEDTYQVLTEPNGSKVTWVRADGDGAPLCSVVGDPSVPKVYFGRRKPRDANYGVGQVSNDILTTTNNGALINSTTDDGFEYLVCIAPDS